MSKKVEFIEYLKTVVNEADMSENVASYWTMFQKVEEKEKPLFTDNGKLILKYLQDSNQSEPMSAKGIADEMFLSSRTVSGAMRKLVTDGYVAKDGENPVVYMITEKGKNIEIV